MGTIACSVILNRAAKTLLDETGIEWSATELMDYLNSAITSTLMVKPDAYIVTGNITLVAGVVQTLPAGATQLMNIWTNAAGGHVFQKNLSSRGHSNSTWAAASQSANIQHYFYDGRFPRVFLVDPPATVGTTVVGAYTGTPTRITSTSDTFPLPDIYEDPIHAKMLAYALLKTSKRGEPTRAQYWNTLWADILGVRATVQDRFDPLPETDTPDSRLSAEG